MTADVVGAGGPDLSIVIPTKDRIDDVRRAARRGLAQEGARVEVVVVDDGSRQPVAEALADLVAVAGGRLRVVRNEAPTGVARARNRGIDEARAPWLGFCDDDDFWAPTKVREHLAAVAAAEAGGRGPVGWSASGAVKVDHGLHVVQRQEAPDPATVADHILAANVLPGGASAVVARADLVRRLGGFDPAFSTLADWDLWVRLANASRLAVVERSLVAYVVQADSMSADTALLAADLARFHAKHRAERRARGITFDEANWQRYVAEMDLRAHRRLSAARHYWAAVRRGRTSAWKLGLVSLASPRWALTHLQVHRRSQSEPGWLAEAESWIAPVRHMDRLPVAATRVTVPALRSSALPHA